MEPAMTRIDPRTVEVECTGGCGTLHRITFSVAQQQSWEDGALIQRVAPELTDNDRELLITATCGDCWDAMFSDDKEPLE